jgi:hypothetical protein
MGRKIHKIMEQSAGNGYFKISLLFASVKFQLILKKGKLKKVL